MYNNIVKANQDLNRIRLISLVRNNLFKNSYEEDGEYHNLMMMDIELAGLKQFEYEVDILSGENEIN